MALMTATCSGLKRMETCVGTLASICGRSCSRIDSRITRSRTSCVSAATSGHAVSSCAMMVARVLSGSVRAVIWARSAAFWPGALTLVVPAAAGLPREVLAADGTVGLRCPNHAGLRALLQVAGPLAASSANRSEEPPATNCAAAVAALGSWAQLALDSGPCSGGVPSSVVRLSAGELTVLRAGALDEQHLRQVAAHD